MLLLDQKARIYAGLFVGRCRHIAWHDIRRTQLMADGWTWIGYGAAACTSLSLLPQAWRVWQQQSVLGVSRRSYWVYLIGISLWLIYGLVLPDGPILVANAVSLLLALLMLWLRKRFGSRWGGRRIIPGQAPHTDYQDGQFTSR